MPVAPRGPAVGKSLATSAFKVAYDNAVVLSSRDAIMDCVRAFLTAYAALVGAEPAQALALFRELEVELSTAGRLVDLRLSDRSTAAVRALRIWTCASTTGLGKEFCSVMNEVLRRDEPGEALEAAVEAAQAKVGATKREAEAAKDEADKAAGAAELAARKHRRLVARSEKGSKEQGGAQQKRARA